jgi:hypothetical protein
MRSKPRGAGMMLPTDVHLKIILEFLQSRRTLFPVGVGHFIEEKNPIQMIDFVLE